MIWSKSVEIKTLLDKPPPWVWPGCYIAIHAWMIFWWSYHTSICISYIQLFNHQLALANISSTIIGKNYSGWSISTEWPCMHACMHVLVLDRLWFMISQLSNFYCDMLVMQNIGQVTDHAVHTCMVHACSISDIGPQFLYFVNSSVR